MGQWYGSHAKNIVWDTKWSKSQSQKSNHGDALTREETINCFEIPEDPWWLFYLLCNHLLEKIAREYEWNYGSCEYSEHRDGDGEQEAFGFALEYLGVSETEHDVVKGDWQCHHEGCCVKDIYGSNS